MKDIVTLFSEQYSETRETEMPLQDYLLGCRDNPRYVCIRGRAHANSDWS